MQQAVYFHVLTVQSTQYGPWGFQGQMGPEPPKLGIFSTSTCSFVVPTKTTFSFVLTGIP